MMGYLNRPSKKESSDHYLPRKLVTQIKINKASRWFFQLQAQLLEEHIRELKRVLRPGYKRLNWNSLGIQVTLQDKKVFA